MAIITSTPTGGALTVNGNTRVSGTISWSKPTIPSGATISSCVLTGTATASLSKGSATITVNGTTVTSGTQFTINLGTANNTTSVTTTAKGGNKNSKGTVSFSNLVYTVEYILDVPVTGITLSPTNITVQQNKSVIVNAILTPNGSTDEIIWSINDTNIATLTTQASSTQIGINGKTVGETTITATTVKSGISVSEKVTVEPLMVEAKFEVYLFTGIYGNAAQGEKITNYSSIIDVDYSGTGEFNSLKPLNINIINKTYSLYEIQNYNNLNYSFSQLYRHKDIHNNKYIAEYSFNDEVTLKENCTLRIYLFQGTFETETSYTVIFKDWDGTVLKTQTVEEGANATPPSNPSREGYTFNGWDRSYTNINSDIIITATYIEDKPVIKPLVAKYTANAAGVVPTFNSGYTYEVSETENNGIYTVEITSDSDFSSISFKSKTGLLTVEYLKITNAVTSTYQMFYGCSSLTSLDVNNWNTSNVTDMRSMFSNCGKLSTLDISNFNTINVTTMESMFYYCANLTLLDVSNFNTGKVENMYQMFYGCSSLTSLDVSNWNTSNVTNMRSMFNTCNKLTTLDISNFNTSKVENMYCMFNKCESLTSLDVSNFNTSNVTNMRSMFNNCISLTSLDISNFDTSKVTIIDTMFNGCTNLTSISMNNSDYNSVNNVITQLPTRTTDSMGTLNIVGIDDVSQVNTATAQSKFWNVVEEPEENIIEWTGIGTVATGLKAHAGDDGYSHDGYKINLDWENESFDIIITDELDRRSNYFFNIGTIGDIKIGDTELSVNFSDGAITIYCNNTDIMLDYYNSDYGNFPFIISFTKKGIYVKSSANTGEYSTPELLSGSENIYEINQPIYLIDDGLIHSSVSNQENPKYNILFDLAVSEYSEQTEEPEEPGNNELLKLGGNTIDGLYIGNQRIIQMYLNGQQLL